MEKKKPKVSFNVLLDQMIAETFTRHAGMNSEEFLKAIGIKEPREENIEVRESSFALITAIMREMLFAYDKLKLITQTLMLGLGVSEEQLQQMKGEKENG